MAVTINGTNGITTNSGTVISASTIGVGGATPSASGAGITFPATANLSSNANTLDDYEEGTFTPVLTGAGSAPTITYVIRTGTYIKVGRMVTVFIRLQWSSLTGGSGNLCVTNLPFVGATDSDECGGSVGLALTFTNAPVQNQVDSSSTVLFFFRNTTNTNVTIADTGSSGYLNTFVCYTTDS